LEKYYALQTVKCLLLLGSIFCYDVSQSKVNQENSSPHISNRPISNLTLPNAHHGHEKGTRPAAGYGQISSDTAQFSTLCDSSTSAQKWLPVIEARVHRS